MNLKRGFFTVLAAAAAVSLVMLSSFGTTALAYKDRDYDDHKDLKHLVYCLKKHGGVDVYSHYYYKCGEKYLEKV